MTVGVRREVAPALTGRPPPPGSSPINVIYDAMTRSRARTWSTLGGDAVRPSGSNPSRLAWRPAPRGGPAGVAERPASRSATRGGPPSPAWRSAWRVGSGTPTHRPKRPVRPHTSGSNPSRLAWRPAPRGGPAGVAERPASRSATRGGPPSPAWRPAWRPGPACRELLNNTDVELTSRAACCEGRKRVNRLPQVAGDGLGHIGQGSEPMAPLRRAVGAPQRRRCARCRWTLEHGHRRGEHDSLLRTR